MDCICFIENGKLTQERISVDLFPDRRVGKKRDQMPDKNLSI
jgi:hypothetical protein